ncbi:MAG: Na/Pi cotransporter family protein [Oceanospirillaceae bacterium]|nr:Na/Pi cotransporter family protein [Oceanospirillaceae bacterium]
MYTLISILGAVSLLLFGMEMVKQGIIAAFNNDLKRIITRFTRNKTSAFAVGLGITSVLQSSTATALLISSFASRSLIAGAPALAVMLGADIGTTLVAQVLSYDLSWLSPALIFIGLISHRRATTDTFKHVGMALIGLGLMLLSLKLIGSSTGPLREAAVLQELFHALEDERMLAILLIVLLTWISHSSIAMILLVMSLAASSIISPQLSLVLVLGANIGGTIPAVIATLNKGAQALRITVSNSCFKIISCIVVLPFIDIISELLSTYITTDVARHVVDFHTIFNLSVALVFLPLTSKAYAIVKRYIPDPVKTANVNESRYLNEKLISTPSMAIDCVTRETMHMAEVVYTMIGNCLPALTSESSEPSRELMKMERSVDRLHNEISRYISKLGRQDLKSEQLSQTNRIMAFSLNLEHSADITENIAEMSRKKIQDKVELSDDGLADIVTIHETVLNNFHLAMRIFNTQDIDLVHLLLEGKRQVKKLTEQASQDHVNRLHEGSSDNNMLHLDIIRELNRINWHITGVAYPLLEMERNKDRVDDKE